MIRKRQANRTTWATTVLGQTFRFRYADPTPTPEAPARRKLADGRRVLIARWVAPVPGTDRQTEKVGWIVDGPGVAEWLATTCERCKVRRLVDEHGEITAKECRCTEALDRCFPPEVTN